MTPEDVRKRVKKIESLKGDPEAAHGEEDDMHVAILQAIANNTCDDPAKCAKVALETERIEFPRWCA
jgi:hypothetical protein